MQSNVLVAALRSVRSAVAISLAILGLAKAAPTDAQTLPDGRRTIVADPTQGPARFIGRISYVDPREDVDKTVPNGGTGILIGPRHVLTAAHVIWNKDFPGDGFSPEDTTSFIPALNGWDKEMPYGYAKVDGIYIQPSFMEASRDGKSDQRIDLDIAVLHLDKDYGTVLGGYAKYEALTEEQVQIWDDRFQSSGYDADEQGGSRQLVRSGTIQVRRGWYEVSALRPLSLYRADWPVMGGGSGGPLWVPTRDEPTVVGVTSGYNAKKRITTGVLLDDFYIDWIKSYIDANP
jgi:V8-like Glu-specific endopeptidase